MSERVEALQALMTAFEGATGERRARLGQKAVRMVDDLGRAGAYIMLYSPRHFELWWEGAMPGPPLSAEEKLVMQPLVHRLFRSKIPDRPPVWARGSVHKAQRIAKRAQKRTKRRTERRALRAADRADYFE